MKRKYRHVTEKAGFRKQCPLCKRWVSDPDNYILSFRVLPFGKFQLIEMCRWCRDEELKRDGDTTPPMSEQVTYWIDGERVCKH